MPITRNTTSPTNSCTCPQKRQKGPPLICLTQTRSISSLITTSLRVHKVNLSLQQALKYTAKDDVIQSAINSPEPDPMHLAIAADAYEEEGEEGIADLLRAASKGQLRDHNQQGHYEFDPSPNYEGRIATLKGMSDEEGGVSFYIHRATDQQGKVMVALNTGLSAPPVQMGGAGRRGGVRQREKGCCPSYARRG